MKDLSRACGVGGEIHAEIKEAEPRRRCVQSHL